MGLFGSKRETLIIMDLLVEIRDELKGINSCLTTAAVESRFAKAVKPRRASPLQSLRTTGRSQSKTKGSDFYTFDECLAELQIDENRLKRLVSEARSAPSVKAMR